MSNSKPWFLNNWHFKKLSYLSRKDLYELIDSVREALTRYEHRSWSTKKKAILIAIADLAKKHNCRFEFNQEGGDICMYDNNGKPALALWIGSRLDPKHEWVRLLRYQSLGRGVIDALDPRNVKYIPLAMRERRGKREYHKLAELRRITGCLLEHPGDSQRDLACRMHFSQLKVRKLVRLGKEMGILYSKFGRAGSIKWFVKRKRK